MRLDKAQSRFAVKIRKARTVRDAGFEICRGTPMRKLVAAFAATLGLLCLTAAPSVAQDWPQKPLRMIAPFPAGGGTDVVARMAADPLSKLLNQPIFVENRGGANGAVGLQTLKQSEPDGYTIAA